MEVNGENNSFITLKDHKENFNNNPTVRLVLGRISKVILDTTNKNIRKAMGLNQWRNPDTVIDWFKGIRNKHLCKFVVFDINPIQDGRKGPPTSFSPVTSTNVGFGRQNFLTFSFDPFTTLVQNFKFT